MTPFDATLAGKRRTLYQIDMGSSYWRSGRNEDKPTDNIKEVTHIVTPFGVFGQCGVSGTHPTVAAARKELKKKLKENLKNCRASYTRAVECAEEDWIEARKTWEPRIEASDNVEVSSDVE